MYRLYKSILGGTDSVQRLSDNAFIPFDPANTDYRKFKSDVNAGSELQDADGVSMSAADAKAFIKTLP